MLCVTRMFKQSCECQDEKSQDAAEDLLLWLEQKSVLVCIHFQGYTTGGKTEPFSCVMCGTNKCSGNKSEKVMGEEELQRTVKQTVLLSQQTLQYGVENAGMADRGRCLHALQH